MEGELHAFDIALRWRGAFWRIVTVIEIALEP